jgi:hypothetical protein
MWRALLPYLIGASIPVALLVAFLAWEFSCDHGWAADYSVCHFWMASPSVKRKVSHQ